jgi:hypothetical protein
VGERRRARFSLGTGHAAPRSKIGISVHEGLDDPELARPGLCLERARRHLVEDARVHECAVRLLGNQHLDASARQPLRIEGALHRRPRAQQRDALASVRDDGGGGRLG